MKNVLCISFILLSFVSVFTQERNITGQEFEEIYKNSIEKWSGKSYRITTTFQDKSVTSTSNFTNAQDSSANFRSDAQDNFTRPLTNNVQGTSTSLTNSTKTVTEISASGGFRLISESSLKPSNSTRSLVVKTEIIKIGNKTYTLGTDNVWRETKPLIRTSKVVVPATSDITYKFLKTTQLGNQNVNVYEKIEKKNQFSIINTTKYWIAEDGRLLKTEADLSSSMLSGTIQDYPQTPKNFGNNSTLQDSFSNKDKETKTQIHKITVYKLDPNIKIEAPIK